MILDVFVWISVFTREECNFILKGAYTESLVPLKKHGGQIKGRKERVHKRRRL